MSKTVPFLCMYSKKLIKNVVQLTTLQRIIYSNQPWSTYANLQFKF